MKVGHAAVPLAVLGVSVAIVSTAAIMIRFAQQEGVPSLAIAFWRLAIAAFILVVFVGARPQRRAEIRAMSKQVWLLIIAAGFFLALHFASWISSLAYTSVASSAALVTTNPIWIALISWLLFRERVGGWLAVGIATAMLGSLCIFLSDTMLAPTAQQSTAQVTHLNPALGNSLALVGSLTVCGYLLIGRRLAGVVSIWLYVALVFSAAAVFLGLFALLANTNLSHFSQLGWLCLIGLALGPQLLGHTGINWSLKHLTPALVAIAILAEPIGSALLAWWMFDERFVWLQLVGFGLLLTGIFLALRSPRS